MRKFITACARKNIRIARPFDTPHFLALKQVKKLKWVRLKVAAIEQLHSIRPFSCGRIHRPYLSHMRKNQR